MKRSSAALGREFALLWLGETIYSFGGALMQFALGVWVYRQTGSAQQFAQLLLTAMLPAAFVMPWAGALADSSSRRWVILATDALATLTVLWLAVLLQRQAMTIDHLYVTSALSGALVSLRLPSYQAAVSLMVPAESLTRATALGGLSQAGASMLGPLCGGALMAKYGLPGIVTGLLPAMLIGMLAVFSALSRSKGVSAVGRPLDPQRLVRGVVDGLSPAVSFLGREPLLVRLLFYSVVHDALVILASAMLTPLVLSSHSSTTLGVVYASAAAGGVLGAATLALANTQRRVMIWLLLGNLSLSACIIVIGLRPAIELICGCVFAGLLAGAAAGHLGAALWARKVPEDARGSMFSLVAVSRVLVSSFVLWAGGYAGEHVFAPSPAAHGLYARSVGAVLGTGAGQGLGLLFLVVGTLSALVTLAAFTRPNLRRLDALVPDVLRAA